MSRTGSLATRWLGVGLAGILAIVTLGLAATDRLALYIAPDTAWFAIAMAIVALLGGVASFALPLGAEADHGHDHGDAHEPSGEGQGVSSRSLRSLAQRAEARPLSERSETKRPGPTHHARHPAAVAATAIGGVAASGVVLLTLVLPPASLSAELAMSRDVGAPPLFAGADAVALATTGDTSQFGVGEWASVFATATNPDAFDGEPVTLTGFVTPGDGDFGLTRLVITHCVIDAQPASIPVAASGVPDTGQWVTVTGTIRSSADGRLVLDAADVEHIDEPRDPYEY